MPSQEELPTRNAHGTAAVSWARAPRVRPGHDRRRGDVISQSHSLGPFVPPETARAGVSLSISHEESRTSLADGERGETCPVRACYSTQVPLEQVAVSRQVYNSLQVYTSSLPSISLALWGGGIGSAG